MKVPKILNFFYGLLFGLLPIGLHAQLGENSLILHKLPSFLSETSALCETQHGIWSINDSQNPSELILLRNPAYRLWRDSLRSFSEGDFIRFKISAKNVDWEALESDGRFLYLGDFGNNRGNRTDLKILKISLKELWGPLNIDSLMQVRSSDALRIDRSTMHWTEITFEYPKQNNFKARKLHNFDCEALLIDGERILLLSKNWKNLACTMYQLPNKGGSFLAETVGTFNPKFLVTDATFWKDRIAVCGYAPSGKQYLGSVRKSDLKGFKRQKIDLKPAQVEGLHYDVAADIFLLSTESRKSQSEALFRLPAKWLK